MGLRRLERLIRLRLLRRDDSEYALKVVAWKGKRFARSANTPPFAMRLQRMGHPAVDRPQGSNDGTFPIVVVAIDRAR
jgi:hypothetical protein